MRTWGTHEARRHHHSDTLRARHALPRHQYGPLPAAAVTEETAVDRTPSGKFLGILWGIAVIHSRADWLKLSVS